MITALDRIESDIDRLSLPDQLWLMEHLAHRIRSRAIQPLDIQEGDLAAMAADPDIQHELEQIAAEFMVTEADGLGAMP
jgi:hypothetical protein